MSVSMRSVVAKSVSATRGYYPAQWLCSRIGGGFILAYHDLDAARFVEQVSALAPNRPVPLGELVDRFTTGKSTAGMFAITFDDGVAATVRGITQACRDEGWPVTFYLPTSYLDEPGGMPFQRMRAIEARLSRAQVRELEVAMRTQPRSAYAPIVDSEVAKAGPIETPPAITWAEVAALAKSNLFDFQSHGVSHTAVAGLDDASLERELRESQDRITQHTGRPCVHFCYPYGSPESIGDRAPAIVSKFYKSATTLSRGRLRGAEALRLPRIPVYSVDDPEVVRLKILTT